jgi:hypothetical protein
MTVGSLSQRLKRLEAFSPLTAEPPIIKIRFISAHDKSVTKTLALGPKGTRTWTDLTDPNNPRSWTEPGASAAS